jgi:hypothetical protein
MMHNTQDTVSPTKSLLDPDSHLFPPKNKELFHAIRGNPPYLQYEQFQALSVLSISHGIVRTF